MEVIVCSTNVYHGQTRYGSVQENVTLKCIKLQAQIISMSFTYAQICKIKNYADKPMPKPPRK